MNDENDDYLELLRTVLRDWYSRPRTGWHVTDITMCPRQRVFKTLDPIPPTDREVNMFSSGRSIHEAIQRLFMSNRIRFEIEKYVGFDEVEGSIDIFDKKKNKPIEFKSIRSSSINEPKSFHVEQLKYYMAMLDVPHGRLIYQCIMNFGNKPFVSFEIAMTDAERTIQLQKLIEEIETLKSAISMKDPSIARGVFSDSDMKWMCRDCPYVKSCESMQNASSA